MYIVVSLLIDIDHVQNSDSLELTLKLLTYFTEKASGLYGRLFLSYNICLLIHLCADVKYCRCFLDEISYFPFKDFL